ncbi:hypothetical protein L4K91_004486 [Salmonella enterica]|nr:hypothetical protein [Salmonella enterica]EIU2194106.1 hypothetical protein [Salmonella enterica]EIU2202635.1 hypothetical protein [Salmonella enterica]
MANVNVVTADPAAVKAKISEVTSIVNKGVTELGALFIDLCDRFTGKDSHSGDNLQHLLNGLEGSKGAKRFQAAIIARLNDFSEKTLSIEYNDEKKTYTVAVLKGDDKKSLFKKEKFMAAVAAAKAAEFSLNPPTKQGETGSKKTRKFNPVKAQEKVEDSLKEFATKLLETDKDLTPARLAVKLEAMLKDVLLQVQPAIEGETVKP